MLQAVTFQRLRNGKNFRDKAHARGSAASYLTTFNLPNAMLVVVVVVEEVSHFLKNDTHRLTL